MEKLLEKLNSKLFTYISLAVIAIVFISTYSQIFDYKPDLNGDNAYYYSLGQALNQGKGFTNITGYEETPHTHFPPGYPLFIAGVMKINSSYATIKVANGVLLGLSIIILFFILKYITRNLPLSLVICLLVSLHSEMLKYSTIVMSEMLFTFTSLCVILLFLLIDFKNLLNKNVPKVQIIYFVLFILILNYIYFVRTMGTAVILAFIIYFGIEVCKNTYYYFKNKKEENPSINKSALINSILILAIVGGSFYISKTSWSLRNKSVGVESSDYIRDFKKKLNGQTMTTFDDWKERISNNIRDYTGKWIPSAIVPFKFGPHDPATNKQVQYGILVLAVLLWGLYKLKRLQLFLFLYLGITMAVLLIWPEQYAGHRYFIGVIPFVIFLFVYGCYEICIWLLSKVKNFKYVNTASTIIVILGLSFFLFPRYAIALKPYKEFAKHKYWNDRIAPPAFVEYYQAIDWAKKNLPPTIRVACRKPDLYYLFSGGLKSTSFPQYATEQEVLDQFNKNKITHVIIDRWFRHGYATIYPVVKNNPHLFKPVVRIGQNTDKQAPTLIFEYSKNGFEEYRVQPNDN